MIRLLVIALASAGLLLEAPSARADDVLHSCQGAPNVQPIVKGGACVGFVASDANGREVQRVASGVFLSGTILASADGRSVVMLHSHPTSSGDFATKDAVLVFRDSKQIAKHSMKDVIGRMELVSMSTSHYRWLANAPRTLVLGDTLVLKTYSQRNVELDVATGKLASAADSELWKSCELLVYVSERMAAPINGGYTLPRAWLAKGKLAGGTGSKLTFSASKDLALADRSGMVVCLAADPTHGWRATQSVDLIWNLLPR